MESTYIGCVGVSIVRAGGRIFGTGLGAISGVNKPTSVKFEGCR